MSPAPGFKSFQAVGHDGFTFGNGEDKVTKPHQAAGGHGEIHVDPVSACGDAHDLTPACGDQLDHLAGDLLGGIYGECFDRFAFNPVNLLDDHFRLSYLEFITLAAHGLDEDGEVEDPPAVNQVCIRGAGLFNAQCKVFFDLMEQAVTQVS